MAPVRHGKSELVSHALPVQYLENRPHHRIILSTYGAEFSWEWGRKVRDTIQGNPELFTVRISEGSTAAQRWTTTEGGGMVSVGVRGPVTGRGANLFLIDDPVKDALEAESQTFRDAVWAWFQSVAYTRLEPGGSIIATMARWHEDDLVGRLQEKSDSGEIEPWTVIRLPALAEKDDPMGREPGEALWPERFTAANLLSRKRTIGSYFFNALYQQRPSPASGTIYKRSWWRFYLNLPRKFDVLLQSWDCAFTDTEESSWVVGQLWGFVGADAYLVTQVRQHLNYPATKRLVREFREAHPEVSAVLIENKANGPAVIADLQRVVRGLIPVNPLGDKVTRARQTSAAAEAGNVYLPDRSIAPWVDDFVEEHTAFPKGKHDDQVDAQSQALARGIGSFIGRADDYTVVRR